MPVIINEVEVTQALEPEPLPAAAPPDPGPDPVASAQAWHRAVVVRTDRLRAD